MRTTLALLTVALLGAACGGGTGSPSVDPLAGRDGGDVLSSCEPAGDAVTTTVVERDDAARPTLEELEAHYGVDGPDDPGDPDSDAMFVVRSMMEEGLSYEDALHSAYGQDAVGFAFIEHARSLPGFVEARQARPENDSPFGVTFSGEVPEGFAPEDFALASYGLEVTTNAAGFDESAFMAGYQALADLDVTVLFGSPDQTTGTFTVEVVDATPQQVAQWEAGLDDPSRWCLVRAERTVDCDPDDPGDPSTPTTGEVLPVGPQDETPGEERAEAVVASYLGLTMGEATVKAAEEDRAFRVLVQDGVQLGGTDDLVPPRVNATTCGGVVVEAVLDGDL